MSTEFELTVFTSTVLLLSAINTEVLQPIKLRKASMLSMKNISKVFKTDLVETHALRDFNLEVQEGEFVAVTGPSGSGKTTFLNIAGLLEGFTSGEFSLDGVNVSNLSDNNSAKVRNEKIGFIFQGFNLIPDLNLAENVEVPLRYRGMKASERKRRVESALEQVGLGARMKHLPPQLSGGQQQRVAIARALAGEPRFLLADEPTGNLDSLMARQVMELLENINQQGTTIIMVTHDPELALRAQRNIQIVDGQVCDFSMYQQAATGTR
jgi:putative ABC transport system ATP-binding protein